MAWVILGIVFIPILLVLLAILWNRYNVVNDGFVQAHQWMADHEGTFRRPTVFGNITNMEWVSRIMGDE
jgi:hypothetical protein